MGLTYSKTPHIISSTDLAPCSSLHYGRDIFISRGYSLNMDAVANPSSVKPALTFEEQVDLMASRGLVISDKVAAAEVLKRINYYRFTAYTLSFKDKDVFFEGTTFNTILRHYEFDSRLRNLLSIIIEKIEIAFRTHLAYLIGHKYGPLGYEDYNNFNSQEFHSDFIKELEKSIEQSSRDPFIRHHKENKDGKFPAWVAFEVLTFGAISKLYKNLKNADKVEIASTYYNLKHYEVANALHMCTLVRNKCAHYSRLFNQVLSANAFTHVLDKEKGINSNTLFAVINNMKYLMMDKSMWLNWVTDLEALIDEYTEIDQSKIGFISDWKTQLRTL